MNEEKYLVMDVPLNLEAENITVFIEVSSNLEIWESGPEHLAVIDETGFFIRVRDNTPVSSGEERFFRFRVELNGDE